MLNKWYYAYSFRIQMIRLAIYSHSLKRLLNNLLFSDNKSPVITRQPKMNWFYCLLIGHYLISVSYCRPDATPVASLDQNAAPNHFNATKLPNPPNEARSPPSQSPVEPKSILPNKMLRANVIVELAQPNATAPTAAARVQSPPITTYGDKIKLTAGGPAPHSSSNSNPSKRYIKNLVFKPLTNITARYLNDMPPTPVTATLDRPLYMYGAPANTAIALNSDVLHYLKRTHQQMHNGPAKNTRSEQNGPPEFTYEKYAPTTARSDAPSTPSIQSIYQNWNFVTVAPPTQPPIDSLEQPPLYLNQHQMQQALLRNQIKQQISELSNLGSIAVPVAGNYQVGTAPNYQPPLAYIPNIAAMPPNDNGPIYGAYNVPPNLANAGQQFFLTPTTPTTASLPAPSPMAVHYFPITSESNPYKYYERVPLTKYGYRKPAPLNEPVVHIGYTPSKYHLSNMMMEDHGGNGIGNSNNSPNNFDTMTHSQNNKNRSEIYQQTAMNTKLHGTHVNNNGQAITTNGDHNQSYDSNWSNANGSNDSNNKINNSNNNKNNKEPNAQNDSKDENGNNNNSNNNNKSANKKQTNNKRIDGLESNSDGKNDVNIVIKIDDNKNGNNADDSSAVSTKDRRGGNNHGGNNHGGNNHGGNNHGNGNHGNNNNNSNRDKKKRKGMKKPEHTIQTILLQQPYAMTTTTPAPAPAITPMPPKTLAIVEPEKHSKYGGYFEKFLAVLPLLSILKPLSFGFWTLALSPLLVVAAGGVAIAVILYPWFTLSKEHQVSYRSRPTVVVHKHASPVVRVYRRRPGAIVRPLRKKPHNSIIWRERSDTIENGPKTMQHSLDGVLEGQFLEREGAKKNLLRRPRRHLRRVAFVEGDEDIRDVEFRNWLLTKNNFQINILLGK